MGQIATSVFWYRTLDNDPAVVDGKGVDFDNFRRNINQLPGSDSWSANANVATSLDLLLPGTQAVMFSSLARETDLLGLAADDVNTVMMGMTGEDRLIGGDQDYTISLVFEEDCGSADIEVSFATLPEGSLGSCLQSIAPTFQNLTLHYTLQGVGGASTQSLIELNDQVIWDLGDTFTLFTDGFETADSSQWSETVP